jgi:HSP20 family protein
LLERSIGAIHADSSRIIANEGMKGGFDMDTNPSKVPVKKEEGATTPAERWDPLASLREEVDHLFEDFAWQWPVGPFSARRRSLLAPLRGLSAGWGISAPVVDIVDLKKEIQVRAELPGMEEKDIDVEIADNMLTIRGERKEEREEGEKEGRYYLSERKYGSFERSLRLPESADCDKPDAQFSKGVLTVRFPKTKEAVQKTKKVKIKAA